MRTSVITEILDRLERSNIDAAAKREAKAIVQTVGRQHGVKRIEQMDRLEFASSQLAIRVSRSTAVQRMMARFCISKKQAYRDLNEALQLCQRSTAFATNADHNEVSDGESPPLVAHGGK